MADDDDDDAPKGRQRSDADAPPVASENSAPKGRQRSGANAPPPDLKTRLVAMEASAKDAFNLQTVERNVKALNDIIKDARAAQDKGGAINPDFIKDIAKVQTALDQQIRANFEKIPFENREIFKLNTQNRLSSRNLNIKEGIANKERNLRTDIQNFDARKPEHLAYINKLIDNKRTEVTNFEKAAEKDRTIEMMQFADQQRIEMLELQYELDDAQTKVKLDDHANQAEILEAVQQQIEKANEQQLKAVDLAVNNMINEMAKITKSHLESVDNRIKDIDKEIESIKPEITKKVNQAESLYKEAEKEGVTPVDKEQTQRAAVDAEMGAVGDLYQVETLNIEKETNQEVKKLLEERQELEAKFKDEYNDTNDPKHKETLLKEHQENLKNNNLDIKAARTKGEKKSHDNTMDGQQQQHRLDAYRLREDMKHGDKPLIDPTKGAKEQPGLKEMEIKGQILMAIKKDKLASKFAGGKPVDDNVKKLEAKIAKENPEYKGNFGKWVEDAKNEESRIENKNVGEGTNTDPFADDSVGLETLFGEETPEAPKRDTGSEEGTTLKGETGSGETPAPQAPKPPKAPAPPLPPKPKPAKQESEFKEVGLSLTDQVVDIQGKYGKEYSEELKSAIASEMKKDGIKVETRENSSKLYTKEKLTDDQKEKYEKMAGSKAEEIKEKAAKEMEAKRQASLSASVTPPKPGAKGGLKQSGDRKKRKVKNEFAKAEGKKDRLKIDDLKFGSWEDFVRLLLRAIFHALGNSKIATAIMAGPNKLGHELGAKSELDKAEKCFKAAEKMREKKESAIEKGDTKAAAKYAEQEKSLLKERDKHVEKFDAARRHGKVGYCKLMYKEMEHGDAVKRKVDAKIEAYEKGDPKAEAWLQEHGLLSDPLDPNSKEAQTLAAIGMDQDALARLDLDDLVRDTPSAKNIQAVGKQAKADSQPYQGQLQKNGQDLAQQGQSGPKPPPITDKPKAPMVISFNQYKLEQPLTQAMPIQAKMADKNDALDKTKGLLEDPKAKGLEMDWKKDASHTKPPDVASFVADVKGEDGKPTGDKVRVTIEHGKTPTLTHIPKDPGQGATLFKEEKDHRSGQALDQAWNDFSKLNSAAQPNTKEPVVSFNGSLKDEILPGKGMDMSKDQPRVQSELSAVGYDDYQKSNMGVVMEDIARAQMGVQEGQPKPQALVDAEKAVSDACKGPKTAEERQAAFRNVEKTRSNLLQSSAWKQGNDAWVQQQDKKQKSKSDSGSQPQHKAR